MHKTIRLFDIDSHLFTFIATCLACEPTDKAGVYKVILDRTAFFPEGGGQAADEGTILQFPVIDVQDEDGLIVHTIKTDALFSLKEKATLLCTVNAEARLRRMQNHSGEHIISGLVHKHYGYRNVGFHLGSEDVTLDFDGELTRAQMDAIEDEANHIIAACLPIKAYYPTPDELAAMTYRAKLALTEGVRIVQIGTDEHVIDRCACCAPHVSNTGEIGIIKLLDAIRYKGGVRLHMHCGLNALEDYRRRYIAVSTMAAAMAVKQADVIEGFERLVADLEEKKQTIVSLRRRVTELTVASLPSTEASLCLFTEETDALAMRNLLNTAVKKCGRLCGVFSGNDTDGYRFVIGRADKSIDLKSMAKAINIALSARGGGSSEMLQGQASATRAVIEAYFKETLS